LDLSPELCGAFFFANVSLTADFNCIVRETANDFAMKVGARQMSVAGLQSRKMALQRQAQVFKALGHSGRMAIIHALADGEVCACDLAAVAGCSSPTASRHLSVLRHAGLIADERRGQQIFYRLAFPCVLTFAECITRVDAGEANARLHVTCCA
jgi:ArsR family transcriptional regulator